MKLTTARLRKLIREELNKVNEVSGPSKHAMKSTDDLQLNWTNMIRAKLAEIGIRSGSIRISEAGNGDIEITLNLSQDHPMYSKFAGSDDIVAKVPKQNNIMAKDIHVGEAGKRLGIDKMLADPRSSNTYLK